MRPLQRKVTTMIKSYTYKFRNILTGKTAIGMIQGNGGTAVSIDEIRREVQRVEAGAMRYRARFYEPVPGVIKILLSGSKHKRFDDESASTMMALNGLRVEEIK